ncbi:ammonia permease [Bacillus pseudomycoides]|uniref:Ammonia permease n=1 Tax=Bacillus pseudomycoides TaxID=64104 RepID=A0AA91V9P3_9BACI|nr:MULTISPECIES: ammonia permease [Bacillus]PEB51320.1 ammonia permease [Bacillus sp. AFS098217]PED80643.1 ammonia permease [Bacillus pseudomycoides]PEU16996.1 ammonia permease [Bacillus sp. AFS019443]PEU20926.1 ammonia permease [Bacillus sp. AFS014408]PFW59976.1 ammonia permease [Bacillus sp. AFS075034]
METVGIFLWIFFIPVLVLSGIIGGIFLIIAGVKHRKVIVIVTGLVCFSLVTIPFILWGMGIDMERLIPIPTTMYWSIFPLAGALASISGMRNKIMSILIMGIIMISVGVLGVTFYQIMSSPL